jgi:hypothetical protein
MHVLAADWPSRAGSLERVRIEKLRAGMVTASDVPSSMGALTVSAGVHISAGLIAKLASFPPRNLPVRLAVQRLTLAWPPADFHAARRGGEQLGRAAIVAVN